ncbi:baseplate assembly protein [Enterobacter sp. MF024]|uniref:baseplate assembly protein n=1 Tax=Enterobacter sp. MF024 TaxID=2555644 RepID=UPI0011067E6B|nr:baseplate assembly protein [Enterobacter sp. MF024]TLU69596.1 baseplate assembly protein [Enterobacter sp. MF024]
MSGTIDLSQLPPPVVIEPLDFEMLFAQRKAGFLALCPEDKREQYARTLELESEPLTMQLEENCYRELLLRQRVNEAARAVMLAYSSDSDLDNLAVNFDVERLTIHEEDSSVTPPIDAVMESDQDLRIRTQQAFEGLSVAGPTAAYEFWGRSADGRVADISAVSPTPACVTISVLSREGDGTASDDLISVVAAALNDEEVRPVADRVTVQSAEIVPYQIDATLYIYPGPEVEPVRQASEQQLQAYISAQNRLGRDIRLSAIYAALHVEGVQRVELAQPVADIVLNDFQASRCTEYTITVGGYDE